MLTKCKDVKPEEERKQALLRKCAHVRGLGEYVQNFLAPTFDIFLRIFSGKVKFGANKEAKMILEGHRACSPEKFLKIYIL